ncbi:hypothetical protein DXG03_002625 [Asterophora parasitica]|uniref:Phytocyanin domain-containing protein n=1 Tax=Asterophora parasitica TaxID=117018 RepID=A0A9P7KF97_9AGAR|nr:hypothetical protein DXG03_002625 [Asterophora parasitica]
MVFIAPFLGAAVLLSGFVSALPRPYSQDSAIGEEVAVSAPNGIPITDTIELASNDQKWSSEVVYATSTSEAWPAQSSPAYGSGSSDWGGKSYDDCVSQCLATYGGPSKPYTPPTPTSGQQEEGSHGNGATHTVIVAPSQGVLRYVPFAVNASVGDTIKFVWGANNHTVTKSSALTPCNKTSDALFTSGVHDKDFIFTQVVNTTDPVYFYCGTPGHCQKGMFGIINPPSAFGAATSVSRSLSSLGSSNPDIAAYASYTSTQTKTNLAASKWGGNIDLAGLPDWAHESAAENVLYTRNFLASNGEVLKENGAIDLSSAGSTPLMIPQDVGAALNNAGAAYGYEPSTPQPSASTSEAPAAPSGTAESVLNNGAGALASPKAFVALFVAVATFLAL